MCPDRRGPYATEDGANYTVVPAADLRPTSVSDNSRIASFTTPNGRLPVGTTRLVMYTKSEEEKKRKKKEKTRGK